MKRGLWRSSVDREVDDEFAFHIEMTIRELMEQGMTRQQAHTEAERRFGDVESARTASRRFGEERDRRANRAEFREELRQDIAFAVRQLTKARGFAAVAVITLGLGIGATAAVFGALDAVVLRALPFENPDRIVEVQPTRRGEPTAPSAPEFLTMRGVPSFSAVAAGVLESGVTVMFGDLPEIVGGGRVTPEYFTVFSAKPQLGRTFRAEEDVPGNANVVVISHRLWVTRFDSDPQILGRRLQLDGAPHQVIGVMPAAFDFTRGTEDVWVPLALTPEQVTKYSERFLRVFARLKPGVTAAQAQGVAEIAERIMAERIPNRVGAVSEFGAKVTPFSQQLVGDYASLLLILLGAVGFVLLIACTNVANLLLARGSARAKELAIRAALGAGRGRLIRQLLTESLVLGLAGALFGLGVAYALVRVIAMIGPENVPRLEQASISWRVLAFTFGLGVFSCIVFGLLPALRVAGPGVQGALRDGGRKGGTASRDRVRGILVAAEVALAITLLVASGLLIRSAWLMQRVDPGFDPRGVLTARLVLPAPTYPTGAAVTRMYASLRDDAARIPGVKSAAAVSIVPLSGSVANSSFVAEGRSREKDGQIASLRLASDNYFATMSIPVVAGRDLGIRDDASAPLVVVVNEALIRKTWPTVPVPDAIGRRIDALGGRSSAEPHLMTIVGVVGDVHEDGLNEPAKPTLYVPMGQAPEQLWPLLQRSLVLVVRAANPNVDAQTLVKPLRQVVARADASLPIADSRTMASLLKGSLDSARMNMLLLSMLGGIALVLAMVGIYGVVSYFVSQRTHEIGVRMALGANPGRIWQYVVRRGLAPIVAGLAVGLALSSLTTTVLRGQLFQVSEHDPATLSAVAVLLVLVGLVATYVPARRAMRVPPVVALNEG